MRPNTQILDRERVLAEAVTEIDAFTAHSYLAEREITPAILEVERAGEASLPGTASALADLFYSLWSGNPALKLEEEVRLAKKYWRKLLGETLPTTPFQDLRAKTQGDDFMSILGVVQAGHTIFNLVPPEDAEKLRDIDKAQVEADAAEQEAQEAEAAASMFAQMAGEAEAQAQSDGQPENGPGQPGTGGTPSTSSGSTSGRMTASQAQAIADSLTKKWEEAEAKAGPARAKADAAKAAAQAKADALLGQPGSVEAQAKADDLRRLGIAVAKAAGKKVEELSDTIQAWGIEPAELSKKRFEDATGLLEKLRRSAALKKFAALLGRLKAMAAKKAKSRAETGSQRVPRLETGKDLKRLIPSEFARLAHPALRVGFYQDWSRGNLRLRSTEEKKTLGRGPVVVCEDASGSMDGDRQQWAKGVVLSLAHFAKVQKRDFGYIMYDSVVHIADTYPGGRIGAEDLLRIAEARAGGGTNFEAPLRRAVEMIVKGGLKKADIAFITDGDCAVSAEFLKWFLAEKKRLEFTVITVICDAGSVSDATVKLFSDRVERASSFTAEEANTKVFAHL